MFALSPAFRRASQAVLCTVVLSFGLPCLAAEPSPADADLPAHPEVPKQVFLEEAPKELGKLGGDTRRHLITTEGKMLLLYDVQSGSLLQFHESGRSWGKPVTLKDAFSQPFSEWGQLAYNQGHVGFVSNMVSALFDDDGNAIAHSGKLSFASDIAPLGTGTWAVAVTHVSQSLPGILQGFRKDLETDELPRIVGVNKQLEIKMMGLYCERWDEVSESAAAGRTLRLARGEDTLYAAEIANYRIHALDLNLRRLAQYTEPTLILENGDPDDAAAGQTITPENADEEADKVAPRPRKGNDLVQSGFVKEQVKPEATALQFKWLSVIQDIAWDSELDRLLVLLHSRVADGAGVAALDLLDPDTGSVERFILRFRPDNDGAHPEVFHQIATTDSYLWFRHAKGQTYRLAKSELQGGQQLTLPELIVYNEDDASDEETE